MTSCGSLVLHADHPLHLKKLSVQNKQLLMKALHGSKRLMDADFSMQLVPMLMLRASWLAKVPRFLWVLQSPTLVYKCFSTQWLILYPHLRRAMTLMATLAHWKQTSPLSFSRFKPTWTRTTATALHSPEFVQESLNVAWRLIAHALQKMLARNMQPLHLVQNAKQLKRHTLAT